MDGNSAAKAKTPNRWFSAWRNPQHAGQPDFADHGTAFGLDLSLNQMLLEQSQPATPVQPRMAPAAPRGWMRRLSRRRNPG